MNDAPTKRSDTDRSLDVSGVPDPPFGGWGGQGSRSDAGLRHMSISEHKHVSEVDAPARRVEIFTGAGRRRTWSADEKAAIVAESRESGARVCQVARRHALTPQQLFAWRREARLRSAGGGDVPSFVPAVVEVASQSSAAAPNIEARTKAPELPPPRPHAIELDVNGTSVWIWREADAAMVTAIIAALKASQ